jgi:LruC domain-containing protein
MNTSEDTYNADTQRYYKSANNLPWAIHVPGDWDYPLEKKSIVDGYKYFGTWAESGGEDYSDWYMSKSDYINSENIY